VTFTASGDGLLYVQGYSGRPYERLSAGPVVLTETLTTFTCRFSGEFSAGEVGIVSFMNGETSQTIVVDDISLSTYGETTGPVTTTSTTVAPSTTQAPQTTVAPSTTQAPQTTVAPSTTAAPTGTTAPSTTVAATTSTVPPTAVGELATGECLEGGAVGPLPVFGETFASGWQDSSWNSSSSSTPAVGADGSVALSAVRSQYEVIAAGTSSFPADGADVVTFTASGDGRLYVQGYTGQPYERLSAGPVVLTETLTTFTCRFSSDFSGGEVGIVAFMNGASTTQTIVIDEVSLSSYETTLTAPTTLPAQDSDAVIYGDSLCVGSLGPIADAATAAGLTVLTTCQGGRVVEQALPFAIDQPDPKPTVAVIELGTNTYGDAVRVVESADNMIAAVSWADHVVWVLPYVENRVQDPYVDGVSGQTFQGVLRDHVTSLVGGNFSVCDWPNDELIPNADTYFGPDDIHYSEVGADAFGDYLVGCIADVLE